MGTKRRIAAVLLLMVLGYSGILLATATRSAVPLFFAAVPLALVPFAFWGREPFRGRSEAEDSAADRPDAS